jgi:hypothetical protein
MAPVDQSSAGPGNQEQHDMEAPDASWGWNRLI